jgi:hypothetical protein
MWTPRPVSETRFEGSRRLRQAVDGQERTLVARPVLERHGAAFCPDQPASPKQVRVPLRPRA